MKPVVICRYAPHEGPGYFATYLSARRIPWRVAKLDEGDPLPQTGEVAGLAMMGGPMSVNDDLPWITQMLALVRESVAANVPVIGHCLGGQLLAKAMGAAVTRNPVKEIGWGEVTASRKEAAEWGPDGTFLSYHWHGETFGIPDDAIRIWSSAYCGNQAFVLRGRHFGMQCHIEMTEELIESWCETGMREIEGELGRNPAVQSTHEMRRDLPARLTALHAVADAVYERWSAGLKVNPGSS
jgi:GMP synthase-like glutamine amidotransferase